MEKFRVFARSVSISLGSWIITFAGIVMIRLLLEQFSGFLPGNFLLLDFSTIIHAFSFFLATVLLFMVILMRLAKINFEELAGVSIIATLLIWIAPIVDLATGGIGGHSLAYLFIPINELLLKFLTFFGADTTYGATLGIRVEIIIGMIFIFFYVSSATKNKLRSIFASLAFYTLIFIFGCLPSFLALIQGEGQAPVSDIATALTSSNVLENSLHPNFTANYQGLLNLSFNKTMSGIFILISIISALLLFFLSRKEKLIAVIKNSRPERLLYFSLLLVFGSSLSTSPWSWSWVDIEGYVLAIVAFICAAIFSICQNDIHDEKIDRISNPSRPLASGRLSREDLGLVSKISIFFALLSAYAAGMYVLSFTTIFIFVYYIYSNPPLRLKRIPVLSSALVSVACLSMVLEGFFIINTDKNIVAFPGHLAFGLFIFHIIVSNVRDIKDYKGDRAEGIPTLPVLLGPRNAQRLIAGAMVLFTILIPWYLKLYYLFIPSLFIGAGCWYFVTAENYQEKKGFILYLIYLMMITIALFLTK